MKKGTIISQIDQLLNKHQWFYKNGRRNISLQDQTWWYPKKAHVKPKLIRFYQKDKSLFNYWYCQVIENNWSPKENPDTIVKSKVEYHLHMIFLNVIVDLSN